MLEVAFELWLLLFRVFVGCFALHLGLKQTIPRKKKAPGRSYVGRSAHLLDDGTTRNSYIAHTAA